MTTANPKASSATDGFFQSLPKLLPQYTSPDSLPASIRARVKDAQSVSDDKVLARILSLYLPKNANTARDTVHSLSRRVLSPALLSHAVDAETNQPTLRPLTTFGEENRYDPLWTTAGWKALKAIGFEEGVVAAAYDQSITTWNRRVHQFALDNVWTCTGTMTGCPFAMTDGAATLISHHLQDPDGDQPGRQEVLAEAYQRLTSRDSSIAWTSGQWMTERTGGSDVSGTETLARRLTEQEILHSRELGRDFDAVGMPLGPWAINGFKWFSSATDSEMTLLLAQTSKGLSAFYVPVRRRVGGDDASTTDGIPLTELNGIRIQRLKNKLGTKSLPTAELELKGARGWLVGEEGKGVKHISAVLNITRLHTASSSSAYLSRGLGVCRAYTMVRTVRGNLLQDNKQHLRWMADETVKYWAGAQFVFFGHALLGTTEQDWNSMTKNTKAAALIPRDKAMCLTLLRLLTPVIKAQVSLNAVSGLRSCMECLGGVGYCENNEDGGLMNIARVFRDNLVNPIWEGTVSVMAEDVVRVIVDKRVGDGKVIETVLVPWIQNTLNNCSSSFKDERAIVEQRMAELLTVVEKADRDELLYRGREILGHIDAIVSGCLLMYDASTDGDEVAVEIASRWVQSKALVTSQSPERSSAWRDAANMDKKVFLGASSHVPVTSLGKL